MPDDREDDDLDYDEDDDVSLGDLRDEVERVRESLEGLRNEVAHIRQALNAVLARADIIFKVVVGAVGIAAAFAAIEVVKLIWRVASLLLG